MHYENVTSQKQDKCLGLQGWNEVSYWFEVSMVKCCLRDWKTGSIIRYLIVLNKAWKWEDDLPIQGLNPKAPHSS